MKKTGLAVALLVVPGALLLLLRSGAREGSTAPERVATPEPEPALGAELAGEPLPEASSLRQPPSATFEIPPVADPIPQPDPILISGTVVAVDAHGIEHGGMSGSLSLWLSRSGERSPREVEVSGGHWQLEVPGSNFGRPFLTVEVQDGSLGRRGAVPVEGQDRALVVPEDGSLALRMRWLPEALLHVRARDTGRELEEVFLYEVPPERVYAIHAGHQHHPGRDAYANGRSVGASPVRIPALPETRPISRIFYAKSPGLAWGSLKLGSSEGGEHELLLDPAGDLELVVVDPVRDPTTRLRIFKVGGSPETPWESCRFDEPLGDTRSLVLEDMPASRYTAEAELGSKPPVLLGSTQIDVAAGQRALATLDVRPPPSTDRVPFAGVLVLPVEWKLGDFSLFFSLDDTAASGTIRRSEMTLEAGTEDHYRWAAPPAPPGRYRVELVELSFHALIDTGPAGTRDARIEVPPPCLVSVTCVDERTGMEVTGEQVLWTSGRWSPSVHAPWNEENGTWEFRAPRGEVSLCTVGDRYDCDIRTLVVGPGTSEVVLSLRPVVGIRVLLREGEEPVTWFATLETLDGDPTGELTFSRWYAEIRVAEPGTYRLVVQPKPGYEDVPAETVALDYAEMQTREIQLRRKP